MIEGGGSSEAVLEPTITTTAKPKRRKSSNALRKSSKNADQEQQLQVADNAVEVPAPPIQEKEPVAVVAVEGEGVAEGQEPQAEQAELDDALALLPEQISTDEALPAAQGKAPKKPHRPVDFIFLGVHGIGMDDARLIQNKKDLKDNLRFIQRFWFWELKLKTHVELIDWKSDILPRQVELFKRILPDTSCLSKKSRGGSSSNPRLSFTDNISDLLSFMVPVHGDVIVESVAKHLNETVEGLRSRSHGRFKDSKVVLIGQSLGGIILYELLTGQRLRPSSNDNKEPPKLNFTTDSFFMWGVPLAAFCALQMPETLNVVPPLPGGVRVFNIFHPSDACGFRFEPLLFPAMDPIPPPVRLPCWRTNSAREPVQWERTHSRGTSTLTTLWASTLGTFSSMFTTPSDAGTRAAMPPPAADTMPAADSPSPAEAPPGVTVSVASAKKRGSLASPQPSARRQWMCQKVSAEIRYGVHDRRSATGRRNSGIQLKKVTLATGKSMESQRKISGSPRLEPGPQSKRGGASPLVGPAGSGSFGNSGSLKGLADEAALKPWLGARRSPATLNQLMEMVNCPEELKSKVTDTVFTGKEGVSFTDLKTREGKDLAADEDCIILSELEEGGGLELPVRLDFILQDDPAERQYAGSAQLGGTSLRYFNYWISRDALFFMLKQVTNFRPRLCYPDFLDVVKFSEGFEESQTTTATSLINKLNSAATHLSRSETDASEKDSVVSPSKMAALRMPTRTARALSEARSDTGITPAETQQTAAEKGKSFFG